MPYQTKFHFRPTVLGKSIHHIMTHLAEFQYTLDDLHPIRESVEDHLKRVLKCIKTSIMTTVWLSTAHKHEWTHHATKCIKLVHC